MNEFESIEGKVAVITGSGRGIGKGIAEKLASHGAHVVISDIDMQTAEATAEEIAKTGVETLAVSCDVSNEEDVKNMFAKTFEKWGKVDILINNAGINKDGLFIRMKPDAWKKVIDVNLTGMFYCTQAAANIMRKQRSGTIVCISSIAANGNPGQANYSASKAGVIGMANTLAKELAPFGIRVNCVSPGFIDTPMTQAIPEKHKVRIIESIPLNRAGKPEDIAKAVLFLTSDMAEYITGHVLNINGGITAL
ncbi:MAG: 3-oxoacyl-ACP reductase FabG [Leptospirales bacterium]